MWADIVILVLMAGFAVSGYKKGFIRTFAFLLGWLAALTAGYLLWQPVKEYLVEELHLDLALTAKFANRLEGTDFLASEAAELCLCVIAFLLVFIGAKLVANVLLSLIKGISHVPIVGTANRLLGAVLGMGKAVILLWLVVLLLIPGILAGDGSSVEKLWEDSQIVPALYEHNPLLHILEKEEM